MIRIPLTLAATDSQTTSVPFQNLTFISGKPQDKSEKQPCAPPHGGELSCGPESPASAQPWASAGPAPAELAAPQGDAT